MAGCADNFLDGTRIRGILDIADRSFADFSRKGVVEDEGIGIFPCGIVVGRKKPFDGEAFYNVGSLLEHGNRAGFIATGQHKRSLALFSGIGRAVDLDFPRSFGTLRDQRAPIRFLGNLPHSGG